MSTCIGEPVSWPRLERYGLGEVSAADAAAIAQHLAACPVCGECFARIAGDRAEVQQGTRQESATNAERWSASTSTSTSTSTSKRRSRRGVAAMGVAATLLSAALGTWLVLWPRQVQVTKAPPVLHETTATRTTRMIKGGSFALELVRMDAQGRLLEATKFAPDDRFKLLFSCPPALTGALRVWVFQGGEVFEPLPAFENASCGNRRAVPGALQLTGSEAAELCAVMQAGPAWREREPPQTPSQLPESSVCVRVAPE